MRDKHYHHFIFRAFCMLVISFLCSCNGSNEDSGGTLEITKVQIIKKSIPTEPIDLDLDSCNHPIEVFVAEELKYRVYYTDPDVDVDLLLFSRYYPATRPDPFIGEHIAISQTTHNDIYEPDDYGFFGAFLGTWRLVYQIEDRMGHQSDPYEVCLEVQQPPSTPPPKPTDEPCDGTAPTIDNAYIYRESAPDTPIPPTEEDVIDVYVNENLCWQVDYTDVDEDAYLLRFDRYYPASEATLSLSSTYEVLQTERKSFYRHPEWGFFGDFPGEWNLEFQLEDECRHRSKTYRLRVNVIRP